MSGIELGKTNEIQWSYCVFEALLFLQTEGVVQGKVIFLLLGGMVTKSYFVHPLYSVTS